MAGVRTRPRPGRGESIGAPDHAAGMGASLGEHWAREARARSPKAQLHLEKHGARCLGRVDADPVPVDDCASLPGHLELLCGILRVREGILRVEECRGRMGRTAHISDARGAHAALTRITAEKGASSGTLSTRNGSLGSLERVILKLTFAVAMLGASRGSMWADGNEP